MTPAEGGAPTSFVAAVGIEVWHADGRTRGSVELHPSMWAAGTRRPRMGILAILADFVISSPPAGVLVPTVDLRVELLDELPPAGRLNAVATMLRVGRRLAVGEAWLDVDGRRCARATATFVTPPADAPSLPPSLTVAFPRGRDAPVRPASFEALIGAVHPNPQTTVVDPSPVLRNGPEGPVQGGIQAEIAEIAAEAALGGSPRWAVTDIDVRYLGVLRAGPLVASTEVLANDGSFASVRVLLRDRSDNDPERLVAYVALRCRHVG